MIYFDNAATTLKKPDSVYEAVLDAMKRAGNPDRGVNSSSLHASRLIYHTRELLAELFHAEDPSRIVFASNATEALNTALKGTLGSKDHVISTVLEHNSVLRPLYELEKKGMELTVISCDERGNLSYDEIEQHITKKTKAIVCTHASNLTGNLLDLDRIGGIAKKYGLLFIVDASQTAGIFDIDVQSMHIDILCFTGHKALFGPQGIGGMYVRSGVKVLPLKTGGSGIHTFDREHPQVMPTALEAGTLNTPGIAGLGAGISFIREVGPERIRKREDTLVRMFYDGICKIDGIEIYGDFTAEQRCPIVTLNLRDCDAGIVGDCLNTDFDMAVRTGGHCAPLLHRALGTEQKGAVRFSFSYFNTEEEIEAGVRALKEIVKG